jgi:hypothetical protein
METLSKQPEVSIQEAGENRAEAKAIYRMLSNNASPPLPASRVVGGGGVRKFGGVAGLAPLRGVADKP